MSELEQANTVLAEARAVLKKSEENLAKSLQVNEAAQCLHSQLMTNAVSMPPLSEQEEEELMRRLKHMPSQPCMPVQKEPVLINGRVCGFVEKNAESVETRNVFAIVNAINVLAISNQDVIEIHTGFVANVNWFETVAYVKGCQYQPGANRLFQKRVRLDEEDAFAQLLAVESEITELVIQAREGGKAPHSNPYDCPHGTILYGTCKQCKEDEKGGKS